MEWAFNNLAESLLVLGILLLVIEIVVLGFATFVLFFVGIGAILTSGLLFIEIIPNTLISASLSTAVLTALSALILWKPLKDSQNNVDHTKAKSDLVGHSFVLKDEVSPELTPVYRYSGIDWKLESGSPLDIGTNVEVIDVSVGKFTIQAKT